MAFGAGDAKLSGNINHLFSDGIFVADKLSDGFCLSLNQRGEQTEHDNKDEISI